MTEPLNPYQYPPVAPAPPQPTPAKGGCVRTVVIATLIAFGLIVALAMATTPTTTSSTTATTSAYYTGSPVKTTTTDTPTTTDAALTADQLDDLFWTLVHSKVPYVSRSTATSIAHEACSMMDHDGVPSAMRQITAEAISNDVPVGDVGFIVGAGVEAYCPRHSAGLSAWSAAQR